jgi:hypothetical protein
MRGRGLSLPRNVVAELCFSRAGSLAIGIVGENGSIPLFGLKIEEYVAYSIVPAGIYTQWHVRDVAYFSALYRSLYDGY